MIKVVAFDLDGTLIDFSIKEFIKAYLKSLYKYLCEHSELAIDEKTFGYGLLQSMEDILKINNDSSAYDKFYQALENYFPFDKELESGKLDRNSNVVKEAVDQFYFRLNLPQENKQ